MIGWWLPTQRMEMNEVLPLAYFGIRPFKGGGRPSHVWTSLEYIWILNELMNYLQNPTELSWCVGCLVMFGNVWWFLLKMVWARLQGINPDVELRPEICIDLLHLIPCPLDRTSYDNVWHAAHWCSLYLIVQVWNIQHEHYISRKLRPPVVLPGRWDWKATNHFDTHILTSTARGSRLERIENGGLEKQRVDLVLSCAWA